jgi:hypothetical protein
MLRCVLMLCLAMFTTDLQAREELSCDASEPAECLALGKFYFEGSRFFPKDEALAEELIEIGLQGGKEICRAGDAEKCLSLMLSMSHEPSHKQDLASLINLFKAQTERKCAQQEAIACYQRALLYYLMPRDVLQSLAVDLGEPPVTDGQILDDEEKLRRIGNAHFKKDLDRLHRGCQGQDPRACYDFAHLLRLNDPTTLTQEGLEAANTACLGGIRPACELLWEVAFDIKYYPEQDMSHVEKMEPILHRQCYKGQHAGSCFALSAFDEIEDGAMGYACDLGDGRACWDRASRHLEVYYKDGDLSELGQAGVFLAKGCEAKSPISCHFLKHLPKE